jgi:Flp pilus assembly protein TadD
MSTRIRSVAGALMMACMLAACTTTENAEWTIEDMRIGDQRLGGEEVPAIEESQVPYAPAEQALEKATRHFARGEYGHSERYYREAAELRPDNVDAWLGLAASYDQLRRFDLAERAYNRALSIVGPSATIYNNMGYSYLLQGKLEEAHRKLTAAQELDPDNPYVQANLELLREGVRRARQHRQT